MTDVAAEILQSYAYATDEVEIATAEFRHSLLSHPETGAVGAIRIASAFIPPADLEREPYFRARLEADAPIDAGQVVQFVRAPFTIERPERGGAPVPRFEMRVVNADARIGEALIAASKTDEPVALTIRVFTAGTWNSGLPEVLGGFELVEPEIDDFYVRVRAQGPDVGNIAFHRIYYDRRFPLLGL
jgi:hypothetical protein